MQNGRNRLVIASLLLLITLTTYSASRYFRQQPHVVVEKSKRAIFSELVGYKFWKELQNAQEYYDLDDIINGMRACELGLPPPLEIGSDKEREFMSTIEEEIDEKNSKEKLKCAEEFLSKIAEKTTIITIDDNKIYYEIIHKGTASWVVKTSSFCLFHCVITTLNDEEILNTRKINKPMKINLSEVIPGFSRGVLGMKGGERRKIYIHPDFAYRKIGWKVPPQTLLIIDVEAIGNL